MVTALVIPIILLYFYWLSKKEMKAKEKEWLEIGTVNEEAMVTGKVVSVRNEKQRFYYHRNILIQELTIQDQLRLIKAVRRLPLHTQLEIPKVEEGVDILLYGKWESQNFIFNRIQYINKKKA